MSDALPTKFMLFLRHIGVDPACLRCNQQVHETTIHVLRDYDVALAFWNRMIDAETYPDFFTASLRTWVFSNLKNPSASYLSTDYGWSEIFGMAIHYLWRIRNEETFDSCVPSDTDVFYRFWIVFKSQQLYVDKVSSSLFSKSTTLKHISWSLPVEGWIKINCDGSVNQQRKASSGGLARDALVNLWEVLL